MKEYGSHAKLFPGYQDQVRRVVSWLQVKDTGNDKMPLEEI